MSVNQNPDDTLLDPMDDSTGLAEIQKAMEKISQLKEDKPEISKEEPLSENNEENELKAETEEENIASEEENINEPEDKKDKKTDKYRKLQNDKYRALAEKAAAVERVKELEQMLNESLNSGTYHYGKNVYSDLEKAKTDKRRAIEEGDVDKLIEADISLNKAILAANDLEKWAAESKVKTNLPSINNENEVDLSIKQEMASDWLETHSYLQPNSRNYNPGVASKVAEFIYYLDDNLQKNNQMDIYYSADYFNTIDNYIDSIKTTKKENNISTLPPVGGVRNSYSSGGRNNSSKTQITLSADEKRMCMNMGMPEEEWIKYKLAESARK